MAPPVRERWPPATDAEDADVGIAVITASRPMGAVTDEQVSDQSALGEVTSWFENSFVGLDRITDACQ